jgi:hypothetical protein
VIRAVALVIVIVAGVTIAHATHEPAAAGNAIQNLTANPDSVHRSVGRDNADRGAAVRTRRARTGHVGGSARIGDSTTSTRTGIKPIVDTPATEARSD